MKECLACLIHPIVKCNVCGERWCEKCWYSRKYQDHFPGEDSSKGMHGLMKWGKSEEDVLTVELFEEIRKEK